MRKGREGKTGGEGREETDRAPGKRKLRHGTRGIKHGLGKSAPLEKGTADQRWRSRGLLNI